MQESKAAICQAHRLAGRAPSTTGGVALEVPRSCSGPDMSYGA